jgi:hypothetical protein
MKGETKKSKKARSFLENLAFFKTKAGAHKDKKKYSRKEKSKETIQSIIDEK